LLPSPGLRSSVFLSPREEYTRQPDELAREANLEGPEGPLSIRKSMASLTLWARRRMIA
jgi:hypothetical protein